MIKENECKGSFVIDKKVWKEVKKKAIDMDITVNDFIQQAIKEKMKKSESVSRETLGESSKGAKVGKNKC